MKRREFLNLGVSASTGLLMLKALGSTQVFAQGKKAEAKKGAGKSLPQIASKDVLREGQPATIANYCEEPEKQPNKFCPGAKEKPGQCDTCVFYNKPESKGTFDGKEVAKCQLLTDPKKPQYVFAKAWCATYVKGS